MNEAEQLCDDIFFGRIYICDKCRRKDKYCSNADCQKECERMTKKEKEPEQMSLW